MDTLKYLFSDLMENSINEAMIYKTYNHVIVKMKSWVIKCHLKPRDIIIPLVGHFQHILILTWLPGLHDENKTKQICLFCSPKPHSQVRNFKILWKMAYYNNL